MPAHGQPPGAERDARHVSGTAHETGPGWGWDEDDAMVGDGPPVEGNGRGWWPLFAAGLALALLYILLPYGRAASALYVFHTAAAAVLIALAVRREPPPFRPLAWLLVAAALALAAVGHGIWYWLDLRGLEPFPSLADAFYLAVYPLFVFALWLLGRWSDRGDGALSDALIVGVSAAVVGWALLIAPYVNDPALTLGQLLVSAGYPVADLVLLPLVLRLVFLHRTRVRAHQFLLLGMLAYLAADVLYAHGNSAGWYGPGGITDGLWLLAYSLFVAAAWHPSAAIEPRSHVSRAGLPRRRLLVLGGASVLAPAVILLMAGSNAEIVRIAAIGSILLFVLVLYRMAGLLKETQRQAVLLEGLSRTDPLTGAANRRHLEYELERELARARREGTPLSVVFLDLDHFKRFNDAHGHGAGDALLRDLVTAWQRVLRPTDVLARFGGEEFVLVLPATAGDEARTVVERLRGLVPYRQTCSAGIARLRPDETLEGLIARADGALYTAKHAGRDRLVMDDAPAG